MHSPLAHGGTSPHQRTRCRKASFPDPPDHKLGLRRRNTWLRNPECEREPLVLLPTLWPATRLRKGQDLNTSRPTRTPRLPQHSYEQTLNRLQATAELGPRICQRSRSTLPRRAYPGPRRSIRPTPEDASKRLDQNRRKNSALDNPLHGRS